MNRHKISQFLPSTLLYLNNQKHITFSSKKLKCAYLIDIIHTFITKYYFFKKTELNLSSVFLRNKYGTHYNYYFDYLLANNYINIKSLWVVGIKCTTWEINKNLLDDKIIRIENKDKFLLKKYSRLEIFLTQKISGNQNIPLDIQEKLIEDLYHVNINFDSSLKWLENIADINIYKKSLMSIWAIHEKNIFYSFDIWGRMHTNFTTLKKALRNKYLKIDGMPILELDIKNSQPLMLALMIKNKILNVNVSEFNLFKFLVKNGKFYDFLIKKWYTMYNSIISKDKIKTIVYRVFFGKNYENDIYNSFFKKIFPSIYDWITYQKNQHNDHKWLSHQLQLMESNLIFNTIYSRIKSEFPKEPVFTVHDSIFFKKNAYSKIFPIFNDELRKIYNKI